MLEHVPQWLGALLRNVRAGHAKLAIVNHDLKVGTESLELASPAFANGARLPERFTADGEGVSPPLVWRDPPAGTSSKSIPPIIVTFFQKLVFCARYCAGSANSQ